MNDDTQCHRHVGILLDENDWLQDVEAILVLAFQQLFQLSNNSFANSILIQYLYKEWFVQSNSKNLIYKYLLQ